MRIYTGMVSGTLTLWLIVCFPAAGQSGSEIIPRTASRLIDRVLHQPFKGLSQSRGVLDKNEEPGQEPELINPAQSEPSLSPEQRRQLSLWFEFMLDLMLTPGLLALVPFAAQNTCSDKPLSQKKVCLRPDPKDFSSPPATDEAENDETEKRNYSEKDNPVVFQPPPPAASDTDVEITESGNPAPQQTSYFDKLPNEILKIITDYLNNQELYCLGSAFPRLRQFIDDEQYPHGVTLELLSEQAGRKIPEFSPDGRYMAMVNNDYGVEVFINTGNGLEHKTKITRAKLRKNTVKSLMFSPDSRYLIIRTPDHRWCLDLTRSNTFRYLSDASWWAAINVFSPSGQYLIVDSSNSLQSVFYQCDSGYLLNEHIPLNILDADFSPDDSCLAIYIARKYKGHGLFDAVELYLYSLPLSNTDAPGFRYPLSSFDVGAIRFIDNDNLMIQEKEKILCFQRMDSGWRCAFQYDFGIGIPQVTCFPKVGNIAVVSGDRVGLFWKSARDGQWDLQQTLQYSKCVEAIAFSPQDMSLAVGATSELHLYTWSFNINKRQWEWIKNCVLTDHFADIRTIAFSSSDQLLTISANRLVIYQHWFRNSWVKIGTNKLPLGRKVIALPDNSIAVLGRINVVIQLFKEVLKSPSIP